MHTISEIRMNQAKHPNIAADLQKRIVSGEYESKLPGISVLAEEYGVNSRTMAKAIEALENKGCVKRIPSKATFVTRLRRQRTDLIGVVMGFSGSRSPVHSKLISGINVAAQKSSKSVVMGQDHLDCADVELATTRELVEERLVDGVIIWPTNNQEAPSPAVNYLTEQKIPFVIVPEQDRELYPGSFMVNNNDSSGFEQLVEHLLDAGYRTISYVSESPFDDFVYKRHRYDQYKAAMSKRSLPATAPIIIPNTNRQPHSHFSEENLARLRKSEAVACSRDKVAMVVLRECLYNGIRVPGELAVAGYDNSPESYTLDMTSVEQHLGQIGEKAVRLLLEDIDGKRTKPAIISVDSELIVRGSTTRE